ncbi:MAG: PocR ligand-binding domain-containing protein [Clostridia bacterium]|nr:PocR ligand-binding domain-containing protein [Clostridia bacterium]
MENPNLKELLQIFYMLSGMDMAVFNTDFRCLMNVTYDAPYCSAIHRSKVCLDRCRRSDSEAFHRVAETGKPYFYTCPFGLFEGILPILDGERCLGYLFIGPGMTEEAGGEERMLQIAKSHSEELDLELLERRMVFVARGDRNSMESYAKLATIFAEYIVSHHLVLPQTRSLGQQIKEYIRTNLGEKITLSKLSKALHCSTVTLTESFRREYGITIMEYVGQERLRLAKELLRDGDYSIREVAEQCGFPDSEYFSRFFKARLGLSPSRWRNQQNSHISSSSSIQS